MSAYIVSPKHINAIVFAGLYNSPSDYGVGYVFRDEVKYLTAETAQEVAQILYTANVRSVNYRYSERTRSAGFVYEADMEFIGIPPIAALKLIDGLSYQSCERKDWNKSEAKAILDGITSSLIGRVAGYSEAAWSI